MKPLLAVFAAGAFAAVPAGFVAGDETPGAAETHLFRVVVPDRGAVVFLPTAEIASPQDASAYLAWVRKTPALAGFSLRAVWDTDEVRLRVPQKSDAALLREGDTAVDPSGLVGFTVAKTPGPDAEFVELKLAKRPEPGEADPLLLCLTNAWVLSFGDLANRWHDEIGAGRPEVVREQAEALRGRFARPGGESWRTNVTDFVTGLESSSREAEDPEPSSSTAAPAESGKEKSK